MASHLIQHCNIHRLAANYTIQAASSEQSSRPITYQWAFLSKCPSKCQLAFKFRDAANEDPTDGRKACKYE
eukprot:scaffold664029_cov52-Prasinocladus_malaysianus.AAC.1